VLFYFSLQLWVLPKIEEAIKEREEQNLNLTMVESNQSFLSSARFISELSLYAYDLTVFYSLIINFLETTNSASRKLIPLIKTINEDLTEVNFLALDNSDLHLEIYNFFIVDLIEEKIIAQI